MFQIQPLSQMDPRWKNNLLGNDSTSTIGTYGCLLTCMTMVVNGFGASETPASLNDKMKTAGGFQGPLVITSMLPSVVPIVSYIRYQPCENTPAPLSDIDATLASGKPIIVEVDRSPAPGIQNHWIIVLGKSGKDYVIQDPWPYPAETKQVLLTQRYGFAGSPTAIIKAAIWYDGTAAQPQLTPKPIPTSGFAVYSTVDGLALRQQPVIANSNMIIRVPLQGKMVVSEDVNSAKSKIGQQDQWIQVIETQHGYQGYVAAWYVSTSSQPTPEPQPQPSPQPAPTQVPSTQPTPPPAVQPAGSLILFVASNGLALRYQPVVADNTLIKHEPLNAQFLVLEDTHQALAKVGIANQWLQVKDIEGDQGYVAAWYVSQHLQQALGVSGQNVASPTPAPAPGKLVVRAAVDNLALRNQPILSDTTLIKRYPLQSEFLVLEPVGQGKTKIGQNNQWLNVRAIDGQQGFVAAWFVSQRPPAGQT